MRRNDDNRLLIVGSMLGAFVVGVIFGAVGMALRPRTALAPAPPAMQPQTPPPAQPVAADPEPMADEPPAPAMGDGEDLADSMPGNGGHEAPAGYPIKGNIRSGIYHVPGGFAYDRTVADRFFRTPEAAEAAGLRHSKA